MLQGNLMRRGCGAKPTGASETYGRSTATSMPGPWHHRNGSRSPHIDAERALVPLNPCNTQPLGKNTAIVDWIAADYRLRRKLPEHRTRDRRLNSFVSAWNFAPD